MVYMFVPKNKWSGRLCRCETTWDHRRTLPKQCYFSTPARVWPVFGCIYHGHMILWHTHCHIFDAWLCEGVIYHTSDGISSLMTTYGSPTTELDVCKSQVMASPSLRDEFAATVELYSTFIKKLKAENPQLNVSEVSFARGKAGKNSYGKLHSTGISNVSNAAVDDILFEKHEYNTLTPDQKNKLRLKRLKRGHVGKSHTGSGNNNGKNNGKSVTIKSLTRSIAALSTKIDKFSLPDDNEDEDEYSDEEEGTSNHSNASLTRQSNKKKHGTN
jgi:hypothetical protein